MEGGSSDARTRVLDVAERLFGERGYAAVTLRDIAGELGMRQASLYHHVPRGKEELFVEVTERGLLRHEAGLEAAIGAGADLEAQLTGAARWLLSQPPVNIGRMVHSDMPAIGREHADRLIDVSFRCLLLPVARALMGAEARGEILPQQPILLAATFINMIEGLWSAGGGGPLPVTKEEMADELIRVLFDGMRPRPAKEFGVR